MISGSFRGVLEAGQRFGLVNAVKIPSSALNYVLPLAALLLGGGLTEIVILLLASRILVLAAWIALDFRFFPMLRSRPAIHRDKLGPLLAFGGWNTVSSLVAPLLDFVDRFFIGMLRSVQDVGFYAAPYEALWRINIIPGSLMTTLFPAFSSLQGGAARESISALFHRALKFLLLVMGTVMVSLVLLARPILRIWLGQEFAVRSTLVFQLIAAGIWLMSLSFVSFTLLQGIGRADIPAKCHLLEAALYIPLLGIGIKLWGIQGAAAAWCFRVILEDVLLYRGVRRLGYADGRTLGRSGLFKVPAALAVFLGLGSVLDLVLPAPAAAAAAAVVYAPLAWRWVLSGEERAWFMSLTRGWIPRRRSVASGGPS
jgi:O-antigen/teichoic acid export membrane protein